MFDENASGLISNVFGYCAYVFGGFIAMYRYYSSNNSVGSLNVFSMFIKWGPFQTVEYTFFQCGSQFLQIIPVETLVGCLCLVA